jgi:hypothetical protein
VNVNASDDGTAARESIDVNEARHIKNKEEAKRDVARRLQIDSPLGAFILIDVWYDFSRRVAF